MYRDPQQAKDYMKTYYQNNKDKWARTKPYVFRTFLTEEEREQRAKDNATARYQDRRAYIESLKNVPCADCGNRFPTYVMDFDHVPERGTKEFVVAKKITTNIDTLNAEIAKCDVVCANCHKIRTHQRRVN